VISKKSKAIVKKKYADKSFFERSEICEDHKKKKLEESVNELKESHNPILSPRSRILND